MANNDRLPRRHSLGDRVDPEFGTTSILSRDGIISSSVHLLTDTLGFQIACVADGYGDDYVINHTRGATADLKGLIIKKGRGLGGKALAENSARYVDDYLSSKNITHDYDDEITREQIRSLISAPIRLEGKPIALLAVAMRNGPALGCRAVKLVEEISQQISRSIDVFRTCEFRIADAADVYRAFGVQRHQFSGNVELSPREQSVLRRIAAGQSNREIALHLQIGVPTVKTYIRRIFDRLNARNRTEAVDLARRAGLF